MYHEWKLLFEISEKEKSGFFLSPHCSTRKKHKEEDLNLPGVAGVVIPSNFSGDATSSFKEDL